MIVAPPWEEEHEAVVAQFSQRLDAAIMGALADAERFAGVPDFVIRDGVMYRRDGTIVLLDDEHEVTP